MVFAPKLSRCFMEVLTSRALVQSHGLLHITLKFALTGREKLTYTFMMDPILSTITMTFKMSGIISQIIFQASAI